MTAFDGLAVAVRETRHEPATRVQGSSRGAMDWNDVRVFLAVAREGSMRAAGRALGLSQPTIARRLAAFEASFGGPALFDRLRLLGLDALEVWHTDHKPALVKRYAAYAERHGMLMTGGSDYHGDNKPNARLGGSQRLRAAAAATSACLPASPAFSGRKTLGARY